MDKLLSVLILFIFILQGCGDKTSRTEPEKTGSYTRDFYVAIIPEKNVFEQKRRFVKLCEYLSKKLNMNVVIRTLPNYGAIMSEFEAKKIDAAFLGSFVYVLSHAKFGIEPIARPVWNNGSSTYCGYIFVRKDSGIKSVKDMKGKRFMLVDQCTTGGYVYPILYFKENGVEDINRFFKTVGYSGSHDASAFAVFNKEADVGACKSDWYDELIDKASGFKDNMMILSTSKSVPSNAFALRKDVDGKLKDRMRAILLNIEKDREGASALKTLGAVKFIETTDSDYSNLYDMIKRSKIDLREYM